MLDIIRVIVLLATFVIVSYHDFKTRLIADKIWIPAAIIGVLLFITQLILEPSSFIKLLTTAIGLSLFGYISYKFRLFHGADYIGFVIIGILVPVSPDIGKYPIHMSEMIGFWPITILVNISVCASVLLAFILIRNALNEPRGLNLYKTFAVRKIENIENHHGFVFLSHTSKIPTTLFHRFNQEYDEVTKQNLNSYIENESIDVNEVYELMMKETVLLTQGLPFLIPMTAGLFISITIGNIFWLFI